MNVRLCAATIALTTLFITACSPKDPKDPRFVAAKIDGQKITRADIDQRVTQTLAQMKMSPDLLDDTLLDRINWQTLDEIIEEKLILKESSIQKLEGIEAEAQKQFDAMKTRFPSEEAFNQRLQESGLSKEAWIEQLSLRVIQQKLVEKASKDLPPLTEAELQEAYQTNPNFSQRPEVLYVQHIFQHTPEGTSPEEKARKKAVLQAALKRLQAGESFETLVKELSEDNVSKNNNGALPPLQRGQTPPEFEKVVFSLKDDQVSPVFASPQGWHVAKVVKHQKAETLTYEQAKPQIEVAMMIEKRTQTAQKLIKDLREKAKVEVFLPEPNVAAGPKSEPGAPAPETSTGS